MPRTNWRTNNNSCRRMELFVWKLPHHPSHKIINDKWWSFQRLRQSVSRALTDFATFQNLPLVSVIFLSHHAFLDRRLKLILFQKIVTSNSVHKTLQVAGSGDVPPFPQSCDSCGEGDFLLYPPPSQHITLFYFLLSSRRSSVRDNAHWSLEFSTYINVDLNEIQSALSPCREKFPNNPLKFLRERP